VENRARDSINKDRVEQPSRYRGRERERVSRGKWPRRKVSIRAERRIDGGREEK
jgi:hypothetical protein